MNAAMKLTLLAPQAFSAALDALARHYTEAGGAAVHVIYGPAAGASPQAITARLERGEPADVVILPLAHLQRQAESQRLRPATLRPVMRSGVGVAVRQGAPLPDVGTPEALRQAPLAADSIGYSAAGSGDYVSGQLFDRLGIATQVHGKARRVADEPVAALVARGELALGFQQLSELLAVPGVRVAGALPAELQCYTEIGAAQPSHGQHEDEARRFVDHLCAAAAAPVLAAHGLEAWRD
jgi:molybdate transport system substrate-binding protein